MAITFYPTLGNAPWLLSLGFANSASRVSVYSSDNQRCSRLRHSPAGGADPGGSSTAAQAHTPFGVRVRFHGAGGRSDPSRRPGAGPPADDRDRRGAAPHRRTDALQSDHPTPSPGDV